jgi:hypothetical protein
MALLEVCIPQGQSKAYAAGFEALQSLGLHNLVLDTADARRQATWRREISK